MTDRPECFSLSSCRPLTIPCRFCSSEHKLHGTGLMPALVEKCPPAPGIFLQLWFQGACSWDHLTAILQLCLIWSLFFVSWGRQYGGKRGRVCGSFALQKVSVNEECWREPGLLILLATEPVLPLFFFPGNLTLTCMFVCVQIHTNS